MLFSFLSLTLAHHTQSKSTHQTIEEYNQKKKAEALSTLELSAEEIEYINRMKERVNWARINRTPAIKSTTTLSTDKKH